jgi:hypothetical protein
MKDCTHEGFHSGQGRYARETGSLRYVMVCDACRAELREVQVLEYRPAYDPRGNDAYLRAAS